MKKLIIIPAYNEAENLEKVIQDVQENAPDFDYIIINDCSTDGTQELCKQKGYSAINLPTNLGIGGGVQTGYKFALDNGYDVAVQIDGDGQHNAIYLNRLFECMQMNRVDMVIGSRFITNQGFQSTFMRRLGSRILSLLIKVINRQVITDPTSGLRMVSCSIMKEFCEYYPKDYPEPESIAQILRKGYKVIEIPVEMNDRQGGVSSINIFKSAYYMVKVSLAIIIDGFRPKEKGRSIWN